MPDRSAFARPQGLFAVFGSIVNRGATSPEVLGPDETGVDCPDCRIPSVRRHFAYLEAKVLVMARVDYCRACQKEA